MKVIAAWTKSMILDVNIVVISSIVQNIPRNSQKKSDIGILYHMYCKILPSMARPQINSLLTTTIVLQKCTLITYCYGPT